jgi:predicted DNA-binding helix-hairpin-helix protein
MFGMLVKSQPDLHEKMALLADATRHECAGEGPDETIDPQLCYVSHVTTPQGKKPILKSMVTTACERGCNYCPFRAGRSLMRRVTFTPDEIAKAFDQMQRAKLVEGIFVSSGMVGGGVRVQDKILATAELIRRKYNYQGYVHVKVMPSADMEQVRQAMMLGDRVSVNMEAPTPERLQFLAPEKDFHGELLQRLRWVREIGQRERVRADATTQFVVGAAGDTDLELLQLSGWLYRNLGLKRAYYSRFNPEAETPLEHLPPVSLLREHRLYQASFLLRDYEWDVEELPFVGDGNLRLDIDPKLAWAWENLLDAPIDVSTATRRELLRIPGIGPKGADAIVRARQGGSLHDLPDLRAIGVRNVTRAAPFILLDGRRPPHQMRLPL